MRPKITVDFDGTLCLTAFPDVGRRMLVHRLIARYLKYKQRRGWVVILNTLRNDDNGTLAPALAALKEWGVDVDYVNENYPPDVELYGVDPRKIGSQLNIDNNNIGLIGAILRRTDGTWGKDNDRRKRVYREACGERK